MQLERAPVTPLATVPTTPELLYLVAGDPNELAQAVALARSGDIAESLNALPPEGAAQVMAALPFDVAVSVLDEPELDRLAAIFERLSERYATPLVEAMAPDRRADLFQRLPERERQRFFRALEPETRASIEQLVAYPADTAGGIMTTDYVTVPADWTVERVLERLRSTDADARAAHAVFVVAPDDEQLVKVVSLRELLLANRASRVGWIGDRRPPIAVDPLTNRDEVAHRIAKYDLLAVPVIDERRRVIGSVTVDDVIDVLSEQHAEGVQKFGGMEAMDEPYLHAGLIAMLKKRAGWLCALFVGEMLTAAAMGRFQGEISRAVVLALFIPLIISSGGNSGSQATSLVIRAMALRELDLRDWWRVAARELPSGIALGLVLGTIGLVRILAWQWLGWYDYGPHYGLIAATVALALVGVVTFGSLAGSMLPFVMRRLGFDPASASAPFVATLVDVTGLVIYFTIALVTLRGTLL